VRGGAVLSADRTDAPGDDDRPPPLVVALGLDPASLERLDALRRAHFPPARNRLRAHVTLFHALPGAREAEVAAALAALAGASPPLPVRVAEVRSLGGGVAFGLDCPEVAAVRAALAARFADALTRQDAQGWRPHVTVQNKVDAATARATAALLRDGFAPWTATALGLDLWRYRGGPWESAGSFPFNPAAGPSASPP
jgi:2'-5' RNA ligase